MNLCFLAVIIFVLHSILSESIQYDCSCTDDQYIQTDESIREAIEMWFQDKSSAEEIYGKIDCWNVLHVTDMSNLFHKRNDFNETLNCWDVSQVTNMSGSFYYASSFNGDISDWDVSAVKNMNWMFAGASSFDRNISNWNVGSVTDFSYMFYNAGSFNGNISNWDVSTVRDFKYMFSYAHSFDIDISNWILSNGLDFSGMFYDTRSFKGKNISKWNLSKEYIILDWMFYSAISFDVELCWNLNRHTSAISMFESAKGGCIDRTCCQECTESQFTLCDENFRDL